MSSILVPLDGSALAEGVLPYVQHLAPILSADVQLLRVVSEAEKEVLLAHEDVMPAAGGMPVLSHRDRERDAWQQLIQQANGYLATQASRLREAGLEVEVAARTGYPAETIVDVAAERHSALIALATHGYGGLKRWMLGSVANKVVHAASTPVLVVRRAASRQPRLERVLVPLDGSALARQALPFAIDLAARAHAQIVLLEAIPPTIEAYPYVPLPTSIRDLLHDQALQELRRAAEQIRQQGVPTTWLVKDGNAAEAIVDTAAQQQIDVLVMATHGYSGIRRWALGSVADKLLHASATPLVLIRARQIAEEPDTPASNAS